MASIQEIVARRAPVASLPQASPNPNVGVGLISDAGSAGFRQLGQVRGISLDTATGFGQAGMVDASTVSMIGETIGNIATAIDSQKKSNEKDRIKSELNVIDKEFELLNKLTGKQRESQLNRINKHLDSFKTNYSDYEEIVENQIKAKRLELQALNVAHNVTTTRADTSMILDNNLREMSKSNDLAKAVEYYQDGIDHIDKLNVGIFSEVDKDRLRNAFKDSGNVQIRRLVVGKLAAMPKVKGMGKILESISEGKEFKDKPELDSISALLKNNGIKFTSDELKDAVGKKIVNNLKIENDIAEEKEKLEHEAEKKYIGLSKQIIDRVLQDVNVESIADRNNIEEQLREALFDGDEEDPRTSAYRNEINRYIDKVFNTNLDISREVNKRISDDFVSEFFREDPETGSTWAELIKTDGSSIDRMIESEGFKDFIKTSHPALVGNTEKQKALLRRASTNNSITTYNNDSDNRVKLISEQVKKEFIASLKPWQLKNPKSEVKKEAINAELLKIRSNPVLNEDEKIDAMRAIKKRFENKKASPQDSVWDTLPEDVKGLGVTIPSENLKGVLNPEVIYNGTALVKALDEYAGDHDSVELSKKLIVDGGDLAGLLEDPEYQNFILPIIKAHEASKNNIVPTPDEDGKESVRRLRLDEIEVKPDDISQVEGESEKLQDDTVNGIAENIGNLLKKPEDWVIDNVVQPVANYLQGAMRGKISESIPDPQIFESERSIGSGQRSQAPISNDDGIVLTDQERSRGNFLQGAQGGGEQFDPQQDLEELIGKKLSISDATAHNYTKENYEELSNRKTLPLRMSMVKADKKQTQKHDTLDLGDGEGARRIISNKEKKNYTEKKETTKDNFKKLFKKKLEGDDELVREIGLKLIDYESNVTQPYLDSKNEITFGIGFTGKEMFIGKKSVVQKFKELIPKYIKIAKDKIIGSKDKWDNLSFNLKAALAVAAYRGDIAKDHTTSEHIRNRKFESAAEEFTDHSDLRDELKRQFKNLTPDKRMTAFKNANKKSSSEEIKKKVLEKGRLLERFHYVYTAIKNEAKAKKDKNNG